MGEIYQHCLCNIAASSANTSGEGLFLAREELELGGPASVTWFWDQCDDSEFSLLPWWFRLMAQGSPLSKRGWVYQERLLSPRTMHFLRFPQWECRNLISSEAYPSSAHVAILPLEFRMQKLSQATSQGVTLDDWFITVSDYSGTRLTKTTDRLIALSGVARIMCRALGVEYYAGVLDCDLPRGLLWEVQPPSRSVRTLEYIGTFSLDT